MTSLFYDMLNHFVICVDIIFYELKNSLLGIFFYFEETFYNIHRERERMGEREREISNISMIVK